MRIEREGSALLDDFGLIIGRNLFTEHGDDRMHWFSGRGTATGKSVHALGAKKRYFVTSERLECCKCRSMLSQARSSLKENEMNFIYTHWEVK